MGTIEHLTETTELYELLKYLTQEEKLELIKLMETMLRRSV